MEPGEDEHRLLVELAPTITRQFGNISVWAFTASFMSDENWVARMEYSEGDEQDPRKIRSVLLQGRRNKIDLAQHMRPRVWRVFPSVAVMLNGVVMLEIESPEPGQRDI